MILNSIEDKEEPIILNPTVENMVDDIYLMISVFIIKVIDPEKEIQTKGRKSLYDILSDQERYDLYERAKIFIQEAKIKVAFNLLDGSHLLNQLDKIKQYLNDFEVTIPYLKKEFNAWSGKVEFKEY